MGQSKDEAVLSKDEAVADLAHEGEGVGMGIAIGEMLFDIVPKAQ